MLVTREKFTQETNGNDNISIVTVSRQNGGIFKIQVQAQIKTDKLPFSGKFLSNLFRRISHITKKCCGN